MVDGISGTGRTKLAKKRNLGARTHFLLDAPFLLFVMAIPFSVTPLLFDGSGGLQIQFVFIALAFATLATDPKILRVTDRLERNALIVFFIYTAVFAISFARSIPNLSKFHAIFPLTYLDDQQAYIRWFFLLKILFASSFVYVLKRTTSAADLIRLLSAICIALFFLSLVIVVVIGSDISVLTSQNRIGVSKLTEAVLGLHYNEIANFYIVAGPLLVYLALKRGIFWAGNYFAALLALLLLSSRTGLFIFLFTSAVTAVAIGKTRVLIAVAPLIVIGALVILGSTFIDLVTVGTGTSDSSLDTVLSGRLDAIWLPLLSEWWNDSGLFYFGAGKYGMLTSYKLAAGMVYRVDHPHNAFIEIFLDNGIIMLVALLLAVGFYLRWGWRLARQLRSGIFWALYLCTVSYIISCFTGRHVSPDVSNLTVFPIMAALINVARLSLNRTRSIVT